MTEQPATPVANTARWTAAYRAQESTREDRLFDDPWAATFAGEEGMARLNRPSRRGGERGQGIVLRTRFFDDFLLRCVNQGGIRQVVLLASGYDSRAFRLAWPEDTRLFELDQPAVIAEKQATFAKAAAQPTCEWHPIGSDLSQPWAALLTGNGFDPKQRTVWLVEGLVYYLDEAAANQVMDTVSSLSVAGSRMGLDAPNRAMLTSDHTSEYIEGLTKMGAPWKFGVDDPEAWLGAKGWEARIVKGEGDTAYGRRVVRPESGYQAGMPRVFFILAERMAISSS